MILESELGRGRIKKKIYKKNSIFNAQNKNNKGHTALNSKHIT